MFRQLGLNKKETQESKIKKKVLPFPNSPLTNNPTQDSSLLCPPRPWLSAYLKHAMAHKEIW